MEEEFQYSHNIVEQIVCPLTGLYIWDNVFEYDLRRYRDDNLDDHTDCDHVFPTETLNIFI